MKRFYDAGFVLGKVSYVLQLFVVMYLASVYSSY